MFLGKNVVTVPLQPNAPAELELQVKLQGCADAGVCYPPYTHKLKVGGTPAAGGKLGEWLSEASPQESPRPATMSWRPRVG